MNGVPLTRLHIMIGITENILLSIFIHK